LRGFEFSKSANSNLDEIFSAAEIIFGNAIRALGGEDGGLVDKIFDQEKELDQLEKKFEKEHMDRLDKKECNSHAGVIFVDVLRNLERIGDHSDNIAHMLLVGF